MFKKLLLKLVMARKEQLMAMGLEMLAKAFEENKDELALQIFNHLPAKMKQTASPAEVENFLEVLKGALEDLTEAMKPMMVADEIGPMPDKIK